MKIWRGKTFYLVCKNWYLCAEYEEILYKWKHNDENSSKLNNVSYVLNVHFLRDMHVKKLHALYYNELQIYVHKQKKKFKDFFCSWIGNHLNKKLIRFGYMLDMKI
jgi:hypothetical protein